MLRRRCLILGNGAAGAENQSIGLAERLAVPYDIVRLDPSSLIVRRLPAAIHVGLGRILSYLGLCDPFFGYDRASVNRVLAVGHPDLVIGCGRSTAPLSVALRRFAQQGVCGDEGEGTKRRPQWWTDPSGGENEGEGRNNGEGRRPTRTIQIQHPWTYRNEADFDLIFTPQHDFGGDGSGNKGRAAPAAATATAAATAAATGGRWRGWGRWGARMGRVPAGNVVLTVGSLHRISPNALATTVSDEGEEKGREEALEEEREDQRGTEEGECEWGERHQQHRPPWRTWLHDARRRGPVLVVLMGGSTSTWTMDVDFASRIVYDTMASISNMSISAAANAPPATTSPQVRITPILLPQLPINDVSTL